MYISDYFYTFFILIVLYIFAIPFLEYVYKKNMHNGEIAPLSSKALYNPFSYFWQIEV